MLKNTKIVQSLIQGLIEVADLVEQANTKAQNYKSKYQAINPDLADTNITAAQVTAANAFMSELNTLANSAVVTTLKEKDHPSHGVKSLG